VSIRNTMMYISSVCDRVSQLPTS